jgi:hypothetical protein
MDGDYELLNSEEDMESSAELSWEELCEREELYNREISGNIKPYQESSSNELEQSPLNTKLTIPTPTPHSVAPPSPPLPTAPGKPAEEEEFFYGQTGSSIFKVYPRSGSCVLYRGKIPCGVVVRQLGGPRA